MDPKNNAERLLAAHLVRLFLLPGQSPQPLSWRALPDGGMVVIASDGRKLWFTPNELRAARKELNLRPQPLPQTSNLPKSQILHEPVPGHEVTSQVTGRSSEGRSVFIALPPSLEYLRGKKDDPIIRGKDPRPPGA
jgi:hypothetical protein